MAFHNSFMIFGHYNFAHCSGSWSWFSLFVTHEFADLSSSPFRFSGARFCRFADCLAGWGTFYCWLGRVFGAPLVAENSCFTRRCTSFQCYVVLCLDSDLCFRSFWCLLFPPFFENCPYYPCFPKVPHFLIFHLWVSAIPGASALSLALEEPSVYVEFDLRTPRWPSCCVSFLVMISKQTAKWPSFDYFVFLIHFLYFRFEICQQWNFGEITFSFGCLSTIRILQNRRFLDFSCILLSCVHSHFLLSSNGGFHSYLFENSYFVKHGMLYSVSTVFDFVVLMCSIKICAYEMLYSTFGFD